MNKERIEKIANGIEHGLFSERETLQEAYDYAAKIAKASNEIAVLTAIHVMLNTVAKELKKALAEEGESEELKALEKLLGLAYQWGPKDAHEYETVKQAIAVIDKAKK